MLKSASYETVPDGYDTDSSNSYEEGVHENKLLQYGGDFDQEFEPPDFEPAGNPDKSGRDVNPELRLVNDYFKEVGTESLMTPREEIQVAAKMRECEARAGRLREEIGRILGEELDGDADSLIETLGELSGDRYFHPGMNKGADKRLRKLAPLLKAYLGTAAKLKNRFVKANLRLVASMAKKYTGRGIPFLDLIQEGNLGLIKAVDRFDHKRGYRFSTYACWWINQSMIRGIFNQTRTVKIPAYVLEKAGKVWAERARFIEENGREPFSTEIAGSVGMSAKNVKQILDSRKGINMVRLDSPVWNGDDMTFMDCIADSDTAPVDSLIAEVSIPKSVERALSQLDTRDREIIKMRFGIGYGSSFTLDQIGKKFDLTRERIRQIEKKALSKIRDSNFAPALKSLIEQN
ncbi:MAG: RNA polymerase sigma factor RpoD/SigA [Deltaproteobacteria bacterium]